MTDTLTFDILARDRMGETLLKLSGTVNALSVDLKKLGGQAVRTGNEITTAERATEKLGKTSTVSRGHLDGLSSGLENMVGKLKMLAVGAVAAFGAAGIAAAGFGIKTAAENESAAVSFELLLGNAQKAKAFLGELQKFAAATPFEMPDLRTAASRLLAVGVNSKDVIPIMTRLGDATAGMGTGADGIERAVRALQQMQQAGKVNLEDINQLTDAGIPALDALAAKLGKTVSQVREDISAGKIKPEVMFQAIEQGAGASFKRLDGMMAKQSMTLSGLWSTFKDNASQALADAFQPAVPGLKKLLDFASQAIPNVIKGFQDFGKSDFGQRLFAALDKAGKEIIPFAKAAFEDLGRTIEKHKDGLIKFGNIIINDVIPALTWLAKFVIGSVVAAWETLIVITSFVGDNFQRVKGVVVDVFQKLIDSALSFAGNFLHAAALAFGWVPGLGDRLKEADRKFQEFAASVNRELDKLSGRYVTIPIHAQYTQPAIPGTGSGPRVLYYAEGGMVPGPIGAPHMAVVHGGEQVLTPQQQRSGGRTVTFAGNTDTAFATFLQRLIREGKVQIT